MKRNSIISGAAFLPILALPSSVAVFSAKNLPIYFFQLRATLRAAEKICYVNGIIRLIHLRNSRDYIFGFHIFPNNRKIISFRALILWLKIFYLSNKLIINILFRSQLNPILNSHDTHIIDCTTKIREINHSHEANMITVKNCGTHYLKAHLFHSFQVSLPESVNPHINWTQIARGNTTIIRDRNQ